MTTHCKPQLHIFPEGEDSGKHRFSEVCPCDPIISKGLNDVVDTEDIDPGIEISDEVTIYTHQRMH